ncbi:MAG: ATP-binding protein [Gemmatimonadota bacterium]|nr:ATP-binding protein [Gemmatimonadota bacterium]
MQSLRRTLSVRFSLTMFIALLVIAHWASLGAQRILRRELDRGLAAAAHIETAILAAGGMVPPQPGHTDSAQFIEEINRFVVIRDASGRVLGTNTPLAVAMPVDSTSLAAARSGGTAWATQRWGGQTYRSVYLGVAHDVAGDTRVVQVVASRGPIDAAGRQVVFLMLGTVALGTVATILGGGWLSKSVVAPVAEITAQAEGIRPGAVGQRITSHAHVEEFNRLVSVLNQMLERLDRGLLAQRRIIADVGHDLRTPITAMRGEAEVALRNPRAPEQYQRVLKSLLEEINHLGTISDTLLLLARIEAGELEPQRFLTDMRELVTRAVQRIQQRAADHPIRYEARGNGVGSAAVDVRMVSLVLDHLLDNAVRHTPAETPVTVSVAGDPGAVHLTIEDRGPGVPDAVLPHLFERFYRGDSARGRGGAGLGLTVAAAIVAAHGGAIRAERGEGTGLRIIVDLPRGGLAAGDGFTD